MATITWRRGSPDPLILQPTQPDGVPIPIEGLTAQLRVRAGGTCIILDGVPQITGRSKDDGFAVDLSLLDLPPRAYVASIYYGVSGAAPVWSEDRVLHIMGGC